MSQSLSNQGIEFARQASAWRYLPRLPVQWIGPLTFLVEFTVIVAASVITGMAYWRFVLGVPGDLDTFVGIGTAAFFYYAIVFVCRGNYSIGMLTSGASQIREISAVWSLACLSLLGLAFLFKIGPSFSRGATFAFFVLGWLLLVCWRSWVTHIIAAAQAAGAFAGRNVILIGDTKLLGRSAWLNELTRHGYNVIKTLPFVEPGQIPLHDEVIDATRSDAAIDGIFLALDWTLSNQIDRLTRELSVVPLPVWLLPDANVGRFLGKLPIQIGPLRVAELQRRPLTLGERAVKRALDLILATVGLIVLLPLMMAVALLIRLDSPGPALFKQIRGGFNRRPFCIYKFRTLLPQEDSHLLRPVSRDDRRLTRIGRILRRTSIDELPQLLNVIRGEMSLVGPRPHPLPADSHFSELIGDYALRHHVKPGLTGWAQVNGFRGEPDMHSMKRRVDFDLWYINNWSFWLDLRIIATTPMVLFRQPMAY